ncbi:L-amino acid N-acyltransferase YncA [Paenibacillus uliginis N3/975]|uniref:L-amino acid N-acyltransferase YncA n=1 Tax=Paenibacillus uliginis N3/975 TaxID=1313296 RepID=A0A1X7HAA0_9BACL|nr:GNAT family N-acetyltransferase [Paenibacillus uliginis]SMF82677.1 L-amino acid N-acyltransferase YncA [Paenibacillus uliginis N3/975]
MIIRQATAADAEGIAQVHVNSWKTTYKGIVSEDYLDALTVESRLEGWKWRLENPSADIEILVLEDPVGRIVGFMNFGSEREQKRNSEGELYAVYLLQEAQGKGWGRQLFIQMLEVMKSMGYTSLLVWVLEGNPAIHFYKALGGKKVRQKEIEIAGELHQELALKWDSLNLKDIIS